MRVATPITLSDSDKKTLEQNTRSRSVSVRLAERSQIVLLAAAGLENKGIAFETDNDTEAGCRFLEWRMQQGDTLEEAIRASFNELDGFFTFLMGTT